MHLLTPDKLSIIIDKLESGVSRKGACAIARVPFNALNNVLRAGTEILASNISLDELSDEERAYVEVTMDIEAAEARAREQLINVIRSAADKDWRAADRALQASDPEWVPAGAQSAKKQLPTQTSSQSTANPLGAARMDIGLLSTDELEVLEFLVRKATGDLPQHAVIPMQKLLPPTSP